MDAFELGHLSVTRIGQFDNWPLSPAEFFPGTDQELWLANRSWLAPEHWNPAEDKVQVSVGSWLIRSADRTIIVDTGLGAGGDRPGLPSGTPFVSALAGAGVTPADVDIVICTHLHPDHVGGNTIVDDTGVWGPTFPHAQYLFSRPDVDFFGNPGLDEGPGRSVAVFAASIAPVVQAGQALIWDSTHVIDEHLKLVLAPGHTPGSAVLSVESGGDRALFVGDLLHTPVQVLRPQVSSCFCHDPAAAARSRRRILEWAADHRALVVPAHFGGGRAVEIVRDGAGLNIARWAAAVTGH
jgi:glyoxylase-like metal-dependent hydrolase (beta-lactamase superfamily II)